jgi:hypothetical protein
MTDEATPSVPEAKLAALPAWKQGDPLTSAEERMIKAAADGVFSEPLGSSPDLDSTVIRAAVLTHLLTESTWPVASKGLRLSAARIVGALDLEAVELKYPLVLAGCVLEGPDPVNLNFASGPLIGFLGCTLPGLSANALKVDRTMDISGTRLSGPLILESANIQGDLVCRGAHLDGVGVALSGPALTVGGNAVFEGLTTSQAGIDLRGARVGRWLVFHGAKLEGSSKLPDGTSGALIATWCEVGGPVLMASGFTAEHEVSLLGARIGANLNLRGAVLNGSGTALRGELVKVGGNLLGERLNTTTGGVDLRGAEIAGALQLSGANLQGAFQSADGRYSLFTEWAEVGGPVRMNWIKKDDGTRQPFTAAHTTWLLGTTVGANLNLRFANFGGGTVALCAERIKVAGNMLAENLTAVASADESTALNLVCAQIDGNLKLVSDELTGGHHALDARGVVVGGEAFMGSIKAIRGAIEVPGARISGRLGFSHASFSGDPDALIAAGLRVGGDLDFEAAEFQAGSVNLSGATIDGRLVWAPARRPDADVYLTNATVAHLRDSWTQPNGDWPDGGRLHLEGLTYTTLSAERPVAVTERLAWIQSQWRQTGDSEQGRFITQPYGALASSYLRSGQEDEARAVAIARRRDTRKFGNLPPARKALNYVLDVTIRYGYNTWRALAALAAVYAVAVVVFTLAAHHGNLIVPIQQAASGHPAPPASDCTNTYPCFLAAGYAIDVVIPLINVHQAAYWGPDADSTLGALLTIFTWLCTALGWLLATLGVAGFTGLVRNSDAV